MIEFIHEVIYPDQLDNMVMVKKSIEKWRIYMDFTDLNKACRKNSFPLPKIDKLMNSTVDFEFLTSLDANLSTIKSLFI